MERDHLNVPRDDDSAGGRCGVRAMRAVLYITYDGLLDPLGGSQILPYIFSIVEHPRSVHILSFEKPVRLREGGAKLRQVLDSRGITWTYLSFTQNLGLAGKLWDLLRMYFYALRITSSKQTAIVHARGHAAAQAGMFLKRLLDVKLIFDFRGLWVDERVDKGGWDMGKFFHRMQFRYFKRVERSMLRKADQIVVLTKAVVDDVVRLGAGSAEKISVIPCCADFSHFKLADETSRAEAREFCDIPQHAFVLGYLGSVGGMYMLDRFFRLVEFAASRHDEVHVLALTPDVVRFNAKMRLSLPANLRGRVHIRSASRDEVPILLPAMDVLVSFARPTYARISMSPTKLAESFAVGIPAICSYGVGDVSGLMQELDAGPVLDANSDEALISVAGDLADIRTKGGTRLREAARERLGLELAAAKYRDVYWRLDRIC